MKRTLHNSDFSREVPSDVTVHAGGTSFPLHKLPLVSKSGYIRKLVSECNDPDILTDIETPDIPGGAEGFELAAKFCYGINFEIGTENVVMLRCVSEYLEMTDDYAVGNLVGRCEAFLNEVALKSLAGSVSMLRASVDFFPMVERVKLVNKCVDAVAYVACEESQSQGQIVSETGQVVMAQPESVVEWWAEDVTGLRIDHFQRVVVAMKARGFEECGLGPVLMLYAQKSLQGLEMFGKGIRKKIDPQEQHEKRVVIETIVSLLPQNSIPITFLSMLIRSAVHLETTVACRLDLEKRMSSQLAQATLDDLLIPSYASTGDTLFDSDTVQRILANYLRCRRDGTHLSYGEESSAKTDIERVGKLMESYLAEIAFDCNLSVAKFSNLAELVPEQARVTEDCMYRAIDIYLKAHPDLTDTERKKLCSLMDCQKLSREACAHAAQNDRLPVQTVLQVLYHEQQRLRSHVTSDSLVASEKLAQAVPEEVSRLRRENEGMKMEMAEMRMKLEEIAVTRTVPSADKSTSMPRKSFASAVAKKLGRLLPLFRAGGVAPDNGRAKAPKDRRHSIS